MKMKTFGHVDIKIGPSLGASKVSVDGVDLPCTRVAVSVDAADYTHPRVELETVRMGEEPVEISGLLVEDEERLAILDEVALFARRAVRHADGPDAELTMQDLARAVARLDAG